MSFDKNNNYNQKKTKQNCVELEVVFHTESKITGHKMPKSKTITGNGIYDTCSYWISD